MKKTLLIQLFGFLTFLLVSKIASAQSNWTKEVEQSIYNQIYSSVTLSFQDDSAKKQFSVCVVQKLKYALPAGLASIAPDSLNKLVNKIGIACKAELNTTVLTKWSPEFEKIFRNYLYNRLKKTLADNIKNSLADCMISQYKKIYPQGMPNEVPIDVENKVLGICYVEVMRKN